MTDALDLFDPLAYMAFIEAAKRPGGRWRLSAEAIKATLIVEPYQPFLAKRSRHQPDTDLLMLDATIALWLGFFLRRPTPDEIQTAALEPGDLIFIRRNGNELDYRLVRPAGQAVEK